jgi:hypothetical protein
MGLFHAIHAERDRQDRKWGIQNHPIGKPGEVHARKMEAELARMICESLSANGDVTWYDILYEEFCEVFAESDPYRQREELIQVAAVAVQMIECIDRNRR